METNETSHTPGPWKIDRIEYSKGLDVSFEVNAESVNAARFNPIVQTIMREIECEGHLIAIDEANLRFIVTACNSHADLLAACKAALAYFDACVRDCEAEADDEFGSPEAKQLSAAIKKARGA